MPSAVDIAAITSAAANCAFVAALLYALRAFDSGRIARGDDLRDCRKENQRLHRIIERRGLDADEAEVNDGRPHVNGS